MATALVAFVVSIFFSTLLVGAIPAAIAGIPGTAVGDVDKATEIYRYRWQNLIPFSVLALIQHVGFLVAVVALLLGALDVWQ